MNMDARGGHGMASAVTEVAPKPASLSEMIDSDLNMITDKACHIQNELGQLEDFLFGTCVTNEKDPSDTTAPQTWEQKIRYMLDRLVCIQDRQLEILKSISRFHK